MPTTITGNIKNLATGSVTSSSNAFIRLWLRGSRGGIPRVTGTGAIAPQVQGSLWYVDLPADASGNISGTVYSTRAADGVAGGDIDVNGSTTAVWYGLVCYSDGVSSPEIPIHAKSGSTLDVSSVTPISTPPVDVAPGGDNTYLRLTGGNSPVTGAVDFNAGINAQKVNAIRFADKFNGASVQAKIDAAIADIGSDYGIVAIPSSMGSGNPTSIPANVLIFDFRGGAPGVVPLGDGAITYNGQTGDGLSADSGVHSLMRISQTRTPNNRSEEVLTVIGAFSGDLSNATNASVEGLTGTAYIYGSPTNIPAAGQFFVIGGEFNGRIGLSNTATIPDVRGVTAGVVLDGNNSGNITTAASIRGQSIVVGAGNTGAIANAFSAILEHQSVGTSRNGSLWTKGDILLGDQAGSNINIVDSSNAVVPWVQIDSSNNLNLRSLGGVVSWKAKGASTSYMKFNPATANLDVDPDGAGYRLRSGSGGLAIAQTGTTMKEARVFTGVAVDPGSIAATSRGSIAVTVTGVAAGDVIIPVSGWSGINDDLVFEGVEATGADQVTFYFYNPTAGAIDDTSHNWSLFWIDIT